MLFNFRLTPIEEITPWGEPQSPNLHWFGLTLGEYWIDVGSDLLYYSSGELISEHGGMRFVDYQVARLHKYFLYLLPHALEQVPTHLENYVWGAGLGRWAECWNRWNPQTPTSQNKNRKIDGVRMWSADSGSISMPQAEFVAEVRAFHDCLFGAMAERIEAIEAGGLPARISISPEELNRTQSRLIRFEALHYLQLCLRIGKRSLRPCST